MEEKGDSKNEGMNGYFCVYMLTYIDIKRMIRRQVLSRWVSMYYIKHDQF